MEQNMIKKLLSIVVMVFVLAGCEDVFKLVLKTDWGKEYAIKAEAEDVYKLGYESQGVDWERLSNDIVWRGEKDNAISYIDRLEYQVIIDGYKVKTCVLAGLFYFLETEEKIALMRRVEFDKNDADCKKKKYSEADYISLAKKYKLLSSESSSGDGFKKAYGSGKQIAEGIAKAIMGGMAKTDPKIKYDLEIKETTFTHEGNTWPILDVKIETKSQKIENLKLTFVLLLEKDQGSQTIVGTIKNIRINDDPKNAFSKFNNIMYIMTEKGIKRVQTVDGKLQIVE
jgi:hypothetical protein